ncbi:uncharacterized protein LOC124356329 [Homalodisca vitripennis]|uniref:uncharacterized protein LOC124356329 n=1 Tax=Homalodisca vitripennis TaxID=197043 RepID=UPI001EEB7355|nr:uncharacterized protein LOC124356329 [Homalodisca vitripennis]
MKKGVILLALILSIRGQTMPSNSPFLQSFGRCRVVDTVEVDRCTWPGKRYSNVISDNVATHENFATRFLDPQDSTILPTTTLSCYPNGTVVNVTSAGTFVKKGVYTFSANITDDEPIDFYVFFMYYNPNTTLSCQFVCSYDPRISDIEGDRNGFFHCLSEHPCARESDAQLIKGIAKKNNFDLHRLVIPNYANCPIVPPETRCKNYTTKEYFNLDC